MQSSGRQKQLIEGDIPIESIKSVSSEIVLSSELLQDWQNKVHSHQTILFDKKEIIPKQTSLFPSSGKTGIEDFEPLSLIPLSLNFWKWPSSPHRGPAIYLVMDRPKDLRNPIILYIGETVAAEKRWKGEHDCKAYLASYSEALSTAGLGAKLSIRFWTDVPKETRPRREIEQLLIQFWLPPFNKETRERWKTPFTQDPF